MSIKNNKFEKIPTVYKKWTFECPTCQTTQEIVTTLSKRLAQDKATIKDINTSVICPKCFTITTIK